MDLSIFSNTERIKDLGEVNERIEAFQKELNDMLGEAKSEILTLKDNKLESVIYHENYAEIRTEVETIKYASQDNFRNLLHTDNYLEKYLPFKI